MPLAARRSMALLAFAVLMLSARCAPYLISQDLRGDDANETLYIYPPGSRPWKPVRATQRVAAACDGLPATSTYFELRQRTMLSGPALVVRDRGKLPPTKAEFDADVDTLFDGCDPPERADLTAKLWARMPRTFADDLLSRYGFDARRRRVDLHAGMRLRIEWAARIADVVAVDQAENGYVGTGTTWWTIGTRAVDGALVFEPAFGWGNAGPFVRQANDVVAGSMDLDAQGLARRFYRLVYPADGFGNTRPGNDNPLNHPVLLGADQEETLDALTDKYLGGECNRLANANGGLCTPLAGRSVPIPEIEIELRGERIWISLGTTLRQILERQGRAFPGSHRDLHLSRVFGAEWRSVVAGDATTLDHSRLLDLPLVKGDRLAW